MLDQSFSKENFRYILDYENRKGIYLEKKFFPEVFRISGAIKELNFDINQKKRILNADEFRELLQRRDELKAQKEEKLSEELSKVSENILEKNFTLQIKRIVLPEMKPMYTVSHDNPESYFVIKQIQHNISRLYKVKQSNRVVILNQVKELLNDKFPKFVLRTDLADFYESIPHDKLLRKINEDNLLTFFSKKIIRSILNEYRSLSGSATGVPRGIGISAYLSELYMRDIDNQIKSLEGVTYYARYVDDIIIIFTPHALNKTEDYLAILKATIGMDHGLRLNEDKTVPLDLRTHSVSRNFEFLGYKLFLFEKNVYNKKNNPIRIAFSEKKITRYRKKIESSLIDYCKQSKHNPRGARKLLLNRINYLTGNTRLLNNKRHILIGIYFSNSILTDFDELNNLDVFLYKTIDRLIPQNKLRNRLKMFSFREGFHKKRFTAFTVSELNDILSIWKKGGV